MSSVVELNQKEIIAVSGGCAFTIGGHAFIIDGNSLTVVGSASESPVFVGVFVVGIAGGIIGGTIGGIVYANNILRTVSKLGENIRDWWRSLGRKSA